MKATQQRNKLDLLCLPSSNFIAIGVVQFALSKGVPRPAANDTDRWPWTVPTELTLLSKLSLIWIHQECVCVCVSAGACFKQTPFSWSPFSLALEGRTFWYSQTSLGKHLYKKRIVPFLGKTGFSCQKLIFVSIASLWHGVGCKVALGAVESHARGAVTGYEGNFTAGRPSLSSFGLCGDLSQLCKTHVHKSDGKLFNQCYIINIAKGTTDPRVQFSLPKSYYKQKFVFDILQKKLIECVFFEKNPYLYA